MRYKMANVIFVESPVNVRIAMLIEHKEMETRYIVIGCVQVMLEWMIRMRTRRRTGTPRMINSGVSAASQYDHSLGRTVLGTPYMPRMKPT